MAAKQCLTRLGGTRMDLVRLLVFKWHAGVTSLVFGQEIWAMVLHSCKNPHEVYPPFLPAFLLVSLLHSRRQVGKVISRECYWVRVYSEGQGEVRMDE